jgi:hypothetical protein
MRPLPPGQDEFTQETRQYYASLAEAERRDLERELAGLNAAESLKQRFFAKTQPRLFPSAPSFKWSYRSGEVRCCLLWTGSKNNDGFGQILVDRRLRQAHRIAYEMAYGAIPPRQKVIRTCTVKRCVRPGHLRAVGPEELAEAARLARKRVWKSKRKLGPRKVAKIRQRYAEGGVSYRKLAQEYDVSPRHIRDVVKRRCWKRVK